MTARRDAFAFGDERVRPGRIARAGLPVPGLVTGTDMKVPVRIVHGADAGPTVWVSAAIHGDEIGGVEIIRRVNLRLDARRLRGTVMTVPIVNLHGFITGDRYLPDRRDLNRSFPGSATGSLAGRIAHRFMTGIVERSDLGIDLHTGSDHRANLPQYRGDLDDADTSALATAFAPPVMLHARLRDGSLRSAATESGKPVLLYEAGEAWRFDEEAISVGVAGVMRVLASLEMVDATLAPALPTSPPLESRTSSWVRARRSGIAEMTVELGDRVQRGQSMAAIHDPFGSRVSRAGAPFDGVVVGMTRHPLVHQGDALIHLAEVQPS